MNRNRSNYLNIFVMMSILVGLLLFPSDVRGAITISSESTNLILTSKEYVKNPNHDDAINGNSLTISASSAADAPNVLSVDSSATITQTAVPPVDYERPVIVVDTYSLDQDTISPGDSFNLFITLYNAGQQYATNVVAIFTAGDLMPRVTGGVVAVGEIAPGNHREFAQPLLLSVDLWSTFATINMVVTYTNQSGISYSETFTITLPVHLVYTAGSTATPTPTQSSTPSIKPQLVINSYTTDITPLQPGTQFKLTISIQNMGNSTAKNVTMVVGGGSSISGSDGGTPQPGGISGASGEFTNFAPIGASNVQSLGDFLPNDSISANQPLIVNVNTTPGAYPLKISFVYINEQNRVYVDDQVITLLVYRLPILEISFYQEVPSLFAGQPNMLPLQVVNLSRNSIVLGNMRVSSSSGQFSNNSIFVGTLDPGGYFTLDASYIPDMPGSTDLIVTIDYTNDFNQSESITKSITVEVLEQPIIEPPTDGSQNNGGEAPLPIQETFLQKVWRFILGLIGLDSGINTNQPTNGNQQSPTEQPIIVPVEPPLKGP